MNTRLIYALLMLCLSWTSMAWAADEGESIQKTIKDAAMAASIFSETRDKQAVLKLYTNDYVGIQDGETETRDAIEKWLSDYESELNKGSSLRFISALSNLQVRIPGPTAWANSKHRTPGNAPQSCARKTQPGSFSMNTARRPGKQDKILAVSQSPSASTFSQKSSNVSRSSLSVCHRSLPLISGLFLYM